MNDIIIQAYSNRKLSKKSVEIGNMQENEVTKLIFELDEGITALGGNAYLVVSYDGESYPYPLKDNTFTIGRELTQRKKTAANIVISTSGNETKPLDGVVWISDTLSLLVDKNSINIDSINEQELPPSLKIIYDDLLNLQKDLQEKRDNDYWKGEPGKSAYQYAQDGGYQGTEEEFMNELANLSGAGQIDEEQLLKFAIKQTTDKAPFHHITDSANYKVLDFGMEGKTEQKTTEGKNLWANGDIEVTSDDNNGAGYKLVTLTNPLPAGTYTLSALVTSTDTDADYSLFGSFYNLKRGGTTRTSTTATFSNEITAIIAYAGSSQVNSAGDTATFKDIQIELGEVATPYEPYTNGPSPNPNFQQEVENAGVYNEETGRYEHKFTVGNKNLLKLTGRNVLPEQDSPQTVAREFTGNQIFVGITANNYMQKRMISSYSIDDGSITLTAVGSSNGLGFDVPVKEGQTYIISDDNNNANIKVGFFDNAGNYLGYLSLTGKSFTTPTGTSWLLVVFLSYVSTEVNITNIQLELDTAKTEHTPHQSQQITLTSPVPLTKWDYKAKRDGLHGWSVWNGEYIFDKDKKYTVGTWGDLVSFSVYNAPLISSRNDAFCESFKFISNQQTLSPQQEGFDWNGTTLTLWLHKDRGILDAESFKAYLAENPIKIQYHASEEQAFIPLPDEEQELLHNLETYYGVTNIYNDQGCPMWLTYVADTKLYVDNQLLAIKEAMI